MVYMVYIWYIWYISRTLPYLSYFGTYGICEVGWYTNHWWGGHQSLAERKTPFPFERLMTINHESRVTWSWHTYLVGGDWNMNFIFPYIGNNHSNWLSYFSEGLKPPTRWAICRLAFIGNGGNAPSSLRRRGVHPARTETPQTPQPKIRILVSLSMLVILFIPCQQGKWCDFRSSIINHYQQSHH